MAARQHTSVAAGELHRELDLFLSHYEAAAVRGINASRAGVAHGSAPGQQKQLAHWESVYRSITWLRAHALAWARRRIRERSHGA